MAYSIDRFETRPRGFDNRVVAGWRVTRYTFGAVVVQHLRSGRSTTGVVDNFGNVVYPDNPRWMNDRDREELIPFYPEASIPPHWTPGKRYW